jgi:hypothetical protein
MSPRSKFVVLSCGHVGSRSLPTKTFLLAGWSFLKQQPWYLKFVHGFVDGYTDDLFADGFVDELID